MADEQKQLDPAEQKLREEGGPIIPGNFQGGEEGPENPAPEDTVERINLTAASLSVSFPDSVPNSLKGGEGMPSSSFDVSEGLVRPEDSPTYGMTSSAVSHHRYTTHQVNVEVNIFNLVFRAVRNFVNQRLAQDPHDSAELGQSMFGPGQRTPLEQAEPYIAIEVYRQVRRSLRDNEDESRAGAWKRFWTWFTGKRREDENGDEEPAERGTPAPPRAPKQPDGS